MRAGVGRWREPPGAGSEHGEHAGDEGVADDVAVGETDHADILERRQLLAHGGEVPAAVQKIALVGVAGEHQRGVPAEAVSIILIWP